MSSLRPACLLALVLASASCVQTTTLALAPPPDAAPMRVARAVQAWSVLDGDTRVGTVVLFRDDQEDTFYSVRNEFQQELGVIDAHGIAYAYAPHAEEPQRVGTGTVAEGARLVLETPNGRLEELDLSEIEDASRCSGAWSASFPDEEPSEAGSAQ